MPAFHGNYGGRRYWSPQENVYRRMEIAAGARRRAASGLWRMAAPPPDVCPRLFVPATHAWNSVRQPSATPPGVNCVIAIDDAARSLLLRHPN